MSSVSLYPPLVQIEQRLFGVPDDLLLRLAESDPTLPEPLRTAALADPDIRERIRIFNDAVENSPPPLEISEHWTPPPAFIKSLIEQKVAANRADFGRVPERGQLVQLTTMPTPEGVTSDLLFSSPIVALLAGQEPQSGVWHGWLVSQDIQYAGFWDFLLQPEDEPFDPACGMVQIWNPVQLFFTHDFKTRAIGRLSEARMQTVEALALEYVLGDPVIPPSRPGFSGLRAVGDGFSAVTGSPLGHNNDPRFAYQQCYHHLAALLNEPVRVWQSESTSEASSLLTALRDVVIAAWRELTGNMPQPVSPVAYAMGGESNEEIHMLALQEDLQLSLTRVNNFVDLSLIYLGAEPLTVSVFDGGVLAQRTILQANSQPLEYTGLDFYGDNRLLIEWAEGRTLELPLTLG